MAAKPGTLAAVRSLFGPLHAPAPPDGGWGWLPVFGSFVIYCVTVSLQYVTGIFLSAFLADELLSGGASRTTVSWAASLQSFAYLIGALPAGWGVNTIGVRWTTLLGAVLLIAGFTLASMDSFATLPGVYVLYSCATGLGCALASAPSVILVQRYFVKRRATATGLAVAGSGVGAVILGPVLQAQVDVGGWRQAFRVTAALVAVIVPLGAMLLVPLEVTESGGSSVASSKSSMSAFGSAGDLEAAEAEERWKREWEEAHAPGAGVSAEAAAAAAEAEADAAEAADEAQASAVDFMAPGLTGFTEHGEERVRHHGGGARSTSDAPRPGAHLASPSGSSRVLLLNTSSRDVDWGGVTDAAPTGAVPAGSSSTGAVPTSAVASKAAAAALAMAALTHRPRYSARQLLSQRPFQLWLAFVACFGCTWFIFIAHANSSFREAGTSADAAALLVSLQGFSNMAGRVILGFTADALTAHVSKLALVQVCIFSLGLVTVLLSIPACLGALGYQATFMVVNGLLGGSLVSLYGPISVELVGLASLPIAAGLFQAVQAPLVLIGPPLAMALRTVDGTWATVWGATGALVLVSCFLCSFIETPLPKHGPLTTKDFVSSAARCCGGGESWGRLKDVGVGASQGGASGRAEEVTVIAAAAAPLQVAPPRREEAL